MIDAVEKPYGTAHLLSGLPMKIAGKTGSAQINNNTKVNAFLSVIRFLTHFVKVLSKRSK